MTEPEPPRDAPQSLTWLWPMAVPVLPLLFAVLLLQYLGMPAGTDALVPGTMAQGGAAALRHAGDRMAYGVAVAIHTGVCLGVIIFYWIVLRRVATADRPPVLVAVAVMAAAVLAALVLLSQIEPPLDVYRFTYFVFDSLLRASGLARDLTGSGPPGSFSPLAVAVLYPSTLGILSVVLAAGIACAVLRRIGPPHGDGWAADFRGNIRVLYRCFYALSAVLVTSTATALLFFQLPVGVIDADNAEFATAVSGYAARVATFWGGIYTLTLFAVYAAPLAILYERARRHVDDHGGGLDLMDWLHEHGFDSSIRENLKNLVVVLAPLLVGPLGEISRAFG